MSIKELAVPSLAELVFRLRHLEQTGEGRDAELDVYGLRVAVQVMKAVASFTATESREG